MKSKWLVLAISLLVLAGCHKPNWQDFSSAEGRFSVLMPGTPKDKSQTENTPLGPITTHISIYSDNDSAFAVSYTEYPPSLMENFNVEKGLDGARNAQLGKFGSALISETPLSYQDTYPGRELQMTLTKGDGKHAIRNRMYLIKNRLYQVMIILPKDELFSKDAVKFMDSFKLQ